MFVILLGMNRLARIGLLAVCLLIVGCTEADPLSETSVREVPSPTTAIATTTGPVTTTRTAVTTTTGPSKTRAYFERRCESRISEGYGGPNSDIPILHIGPVALLAFDPEWLAANTYYMEPTSTGRYEGIKFVLVVSQTAIGPVTVSIPESDRDHVRLAYDPGRSAPYLWEEADHTVKFGVCSGRLDGRPLDAQYNGGFVVNTPVCARVVVADDGVEGSEWSASIPFGVPVDGCMILD
jgi:hypothetical protein